MAETKMSVTLIGHTQLSESFRMQVEDPYGDWKTTHGGAIALTAIRTCYSHLRPTEILPTEGAKYFGREATDGAGGNEADRLFRHIVNSKHTSTLEHLSFTFVIEGVSRALLAQLTRHRHMSFSVQSQRYVRMGSDDKSGGFDYVVPPSVKGNDDSHREFEMSMADAQVAYDALRSAGVPPEDARLVLPNAAATNLVMTANLRTLLEFCEKRRKGGGAQWEIAELAEALRDCVVAVEPWTAQFFDRGANRGETA